MKTTASLCALTAALLISSVARSEEATSAEPSMNESPPPVLDSVRRIRVGSPRHRYELLDAPIEVDEIDLAGFSVEENGPDRTAISFDLHPEEAIWGCGQRLDAFNLRGRQLEHWVTDGWNRIDTSYMAVPFFISSRGYGLFINHPGRVEFDIGHEHADQFHISVPDEGVEIIYFEGAPNEIARAYTELVGRPRSAPYWIFRPWMSRNSYFGSDEVTDVVSRMKSLGMPIGIVVLEAWGEQLHNFQFERRRYPLPITWMQELKADGVRVVCWITPSVWTDSLAYEVAHENGWIVLNADGSEHVVRWLEDGRKIDFRIPAARDWWQNLHLPLIEMGVSGFKTDGGEHMPDPLFHNQHPYYYQRASLDAFNKAGREGITFARSGGPLNAGLSTFWAGDQHAEWSRLAAVVRGGLSAALSGFPLWGHDIGAYTGIPEKELYIRWLQLGAFSPIMQFHGIEGREPWHYDEETIAIAAFYFRVRERLQPWLSEWGQDAVNEGIPIMRPLIWHFPDDPMTHSLDSQFMLGPDLLIAPQVDSSGSRSIYLPAESWFDLWSGEQIEGPITLERSPALYQLPAFARTSAKHRFNDLFANAPIPEGSSIQVTLQGDPNERGIIPSRRYLDITHLRERYEYEVTNLSSTSQVVGIRLSPAPGIHVEPNQIIRFTLGPNESRPVIFDVTAQPQTAPGTYPLRLEVRGADTDFPSQMMQVVVSPQWYGLGSFPGGVDSPLNIDPTDIDLDESSSDHHDQPHPWQQLPKDITEREGRMDLSPWLGGGGYSSSYLYTQIESESLQQVHLVVGSGDGLTVWVNGRELLHRPTHRNPERDQERIPAVFTRGKNEILVRLHRDLAPHHLYFRVE